MIFRKQISDMHHVCHLPRSSRYSLERRVNVVDRPISKWTTIPPLSPNSTTTTPPFKAHIYIVAELVVPSVRPDPYFARMTSPPQRTAWNAEVDKLKNRLSVLSQSSLDDEDQRRLRELGMEQHKSEEGSGPGGTNLYDEVVTSGRSDFDLAREREDKTDEMRYDCESTSHAFLLDPSASPLNSV